MINSSVIGGTFGVAAISPPNNLSQGQPFTSDKAYRNFIARSTANPLEYWDSLAKELKWAQEPCQTEDPSDWFPGGRLNLTESLLASWQEPEPMFAVYKNDVLNTVNAGMTKGCIGAICKRFDRMGLSRGDRILIGISSGFELLCATLAAFRLGMTAVPVDPATGDPRRLSRRAQTAGCKAALAWSGDFESGISDYEQFQKLPAIKTDILESEWESGACPMPPSVEVKASTPAVVLANSYGSMFALSTAGMALHGLSAYRHLLNGRGKRDLHWFQAPVDHASFLIGTMGAVLAGGQVATPVLLRPMSLESFKSSINSIRPRVMVCQSNIMDSISALSQEQGTADTAGFAPALLVLEGTSVCPSLFLRIRHDLFAGQTHVIQALSRPEVSGYIAGPNPGTSPVRPGSCSLSAPGIRLVTVDQTGRPCQPFHGGLLAVDSIPPGIAISYQTQPPPVILPVKAKQDRDNQIWPVGQTRIKESNDIRIPSTEIEAFISSQSDIIAAAVVATKDRDGGVHTRAFIVTGESKREETISKLRKAISEHFGARFVPDVIQTVPDLPVSRSGKLLRSVLRRVATGDTQGLEQLGQVTDRSLLDKLIQGSGIYTDPERKGDGP